MLRSRRVTRGLHASARRALAEGVEVEARGSLKGSIDYPVRSGVIGCYPDGVLVGAVTHCLTYHPCGHGNSYGVDAYGRYAL